MNRSARLSLTLLLALGACSGDPPSKGAGIQPPEPAEVLYGSVRERDRSGQADGARFTALVRAQNALTAEAAGRSAG